MDSRTAITIHELGEGLSPGMSRRGLCPWCNGGERNEHSFVVRATDSGLSYSCYRASCSATYRSRGHIGDMGLRPPSGDDILAPVQHRKLNPYRSTLTPLPTDMLTMFRDKFDLTPEELTAGGFKWAPEDHRVYMPVYGPMGKRRGAMLRSYADNPRIKAIAYPESQAPWQAWYKLGTGRPDGIDQPLILVVVEDQVSALKTARHYNTVATLGTYLTEDRLAELAAIGARNVLFALDQDATGKAIDMMRQNMLLFESTGVVFLDKDFKDSPDAEIRARVKEALTE